MRSPHSWFRAVACAALVAVTGPTLVACGTDTSTSRTDPTTSAGSQRPVIDPGDSGTYTPELRPAEFVDVIDNPYLPLIPGSSWLYEGTVDGEHERVEVVVTPERRTVMGIPAVVVRDTVTSPDGEPVEVTDDWYAQDSSGNVWYLGEKTKEYEDGKVVSTEGSWEAGVDGARPGIVMRATPTVGDAYRQEYYRGEAEDMAEVVRLDATARVPAGNYDKVVVTREWTPLEPRIVEEKYYARGVGMVLEVRVTGGKGRVGLTRFTAGRR